MSDRKRPKRLREPEDFSSPPKSKQTKIDDFIGGSAAIYNIPVSNRYAALTQEETNLEGNATASELGSDSILGKKPCCDSEMNLNSLSELTLFTVSHILGYLKEIRMKLEKLEGMLELSLGPKGKSLPTLQLSSNNLPAKTAAPGLSKRQDPFTNTNTRSLDSPVDTQPSSHLVLQSNQICLTICSYQGGVPRWNTRGLALNHLSTILGERASKIDLEASEVISLPNQVMRILLTFSSGRFPSLMMKHHTIFRRKGVFPGRVFTNISKPSPLLPRIPSNSGGKNILPPGQPDLMDFSYQEAKLSPPVMACQSASIMERHLSALNHKQGDINLDNSLEEDLKEVFPKLPREDQAAIVDRLESLKTDLLALGEEGGSLELGSLRGTIPQHPCMAPDVAGYLSSPVSPIKVTLTNKVPNTLQPDEETSGNILGDKNGEAHCSSAEPIGLITPSDAAVQRGAALKNGGLFSNNSEARMKSSFVPLHRHKPLSSPAQGRIQLHRKKKKVGYFAHITSIIRGYPKSKKMLFVGRNRSVLAQTPLIPERGLETSTSTSGNVTFLLAGKSSLWWKQRKGPWKSSRST